MKLRDGGITIIIIIGVLAIAGYLSSRWLGNDNFIEDYSEDMIESYTGLEIEFSPEEGENHDNCESDRKEDS